MTDDVRRPAPDEPTPEAPEVPEVPEPTPEVPEVPESTPAAPEAGVAPVAPEPAEAPAVAEREPPVEIPDRPFVAGTDGSPVTVARVDPAASPPGPVAAASCPGDGTCGREDCQCGRSRFDRRRFLGYALTIAAGVAGAAALSQLAPLFAASEEASSAEPITPVYDPETVAWTFVVDTSLCIGCGLCVGACKEENNVPENAHYNRTWVERHVVTPNGQVHIDSPEGGIEGFPPLSEAPGVGGRPITDAYFVPRLCMQCENPPCVSVCPVSATYVSVEGIVLIDDARCIGCAYCIVACPYGARYLIPASERTPLGIPGVADKCTWCYHRIARGLVPACVEVCPVGSRKFGDRNDPRSEVARIMAAGAAEPLWPEYDTKPRLYYLGPITEETA